MPTNLCEVYVNDYSLLDLATDNGFTLWIQAWSGIRGGVADRLASVDVPGRLGSVITSLTPNTSAKAVTMTLRVKAPSASYVDAYTQIIVGWLSQGYVTLRTDLNPTREAIGRLSELNVALMDESGNPTSRIDATFTLNDPLWYETTPHRYALANGDPLAIAQGTGPMRWTARIRGPGENPVLSYRDTRGIVRASLAFVVTLGAADYLDIDPSDKTVRLVSSGVAGPIADGLALMQAGSFFPSVSPSDGANPQFVLTDNDSTVTGLISTLRSYR